VAELTYDRSFGYSTEGQLLGHIVIGLRMLHEKLQQVPDFPPKLRVLVEHLIVSHHGELEYGSPKVPLFPEAMLLHHLDNLDSKMESMRGLAEKDRHIEGCWTGYSPSLERSVLKKTKYLEDAPTPEPAPAPMPAELAARHSQQRPEAQQRPEGQQPPEAQRPPEHRQPPEPQQQRFAPTSSPFAEKLQQAWRKDS
jgi:3'-5' exoribonuclease